MEHPQKSQYKEHLARYKNKRKLIGESIVQSTSVMKSTTGVTHNNPSNPAEIENTTRKVEKFISSEDLAQKSEIKPRTDVKNRLTLGQSHLDVDHDLYTMK